MAPRTAIGRRRLALLALVCALSGLVASPRLSHASTTSASTSPEPGGDLLVDRWTVEDGLPLDQLTDLAIRADGTLWIATYDGLVSFDGERFHVLRRATVPALPSNRFTSLDAAPDGTLWAASEDGDLVRFGPEQREPVVYRRGADLPGQISGLFRAGGTLWGTSDVGLLRLEPRPELVVGTPPGTSLNSVSVARDGALWTGSDGDGVFRYTPGESARAVLAPREHDRMLRVLAVDDDGTVWAGGGGLYRIAANEAVTSIRGVGAALSDVCEVTRRPDGAVEVRDRHGWWRVTGDEATLALKADVPRCQLAPRGASPWPWRIAGTQITRDAAPVYTSRHPIVSLLVSADGAAWVATAGDGLVRLRPRLVHAVAPPASWRRPSVEAVLAGRSGAMWMGSITEGLWRIGDDSPVAFSIRRPDGQPPGVLGLVEHAEGAVEVGTDVQLCRVESGAAAATVEGDLAESPPQCEASAEGWRGDSQEVLVPLLVDRRGRTWFGGLDTWVNGKDGLFVRQGAASTEMWREVRDPDGAVVKDARAATEGRDGSVYVATATGGVLRVRDSGVERVDTSGGLSSDRIRSLYVDPLDVVWIGTEDAGLCRWTPATKQVGCIGTAEGLYDDVVHAILPDDSGRFWLSGNRGISWVRRGTVDAVLDGSEASVLAVGLSERDGMVSREGNGGLPHSAARDAHGRLWFATQHGVAWVDPREVPAPPRPAVRLVSLRLGEVLVSLPLAKGEVLAVAADVRSLEAEWSAVALDHGADMRFRYRLAGYDDEWRRPTRERSATWLGLPPHRVVLEIQAGLGGVWGDRLQVALERAPSFTETAWLPVSAGLGVILLAALAMLGWGGRQRRRREVLEREIARRTADLTQANHELAASAAERAAQAARLMELSELRQRFVADLSHELRTPLAWVAGPLEDLAAGLVGAMDAQATRRLELVRANVARLEVLSDELLDVGRLEAGQVRLRARRHDLVGFVRGVCERFQLAFEERGLRLQVEAAPASAALYFDRDLLDKIVANLVGNALKFTARGGVSVRVDGGADAQDEGFARVSVQDTGIGIAAAQHEHIFNRFFQVDRGDQRRYEGVGIGLALVRELVALHGGEVGVESEVGVGSTFWFTLPLGAAHLTLDEIDPQPRPRDGAAAVGMSVGPPEPSSGGTTEDDDRPAVLVVEDHPDMRAYLALHLGERFAVWEADSGISALARLGERVPAAIVSDVMMPGMDGLELCRRVRADERLRGIPVLLVSAKAGDDDRVAGLELAEDYLTKPVRPRELVARVSRLIQARVGQPGGARREDEAPPVAHRPPPATPQPTHEPPASPEAEPAPRATTDAPLLDAAGDRQLARIDATIEAHLAEPAFGVIELAAALGLSRRQLQREIRRLTGLSPSEHLRGARMAAAERRLKSGARDTVAEVAADVGLSPAYFSRLYSTWFGRAPSDDLANRS
ncbi:MAG: ATP-binding protein [Myxococcota bacterium]